MTVREAIAALPILEQLEVLEPADAEFAYVLGVLRACCDSSGLAERLPALLQGIAVEIQRVRSGAAGALDTRGALDAARRLWSGEPGPN